jgi:hypothetical protein
VYREIPAPWATLLHVPEVVPLFGGVHWRSRLTAQNGIG